MIFIPDRRRVKQDVLETINKIVDWKQIDTLLKQYYSKGKNVVGRDSYPALVLFKMVLLGYLYGLSDYEVEEQVKDRVSFSKFVGIPLSDDVPDHSVISRFRTILSHKGAYKKILNLINNQLGNRQILVRANGILDASIIDSPRKPNTKPDIILEDRKENDINNDSSPKENTKQYTVLEDRKKDNTYEDSNKRSYPSSVDTDAKWIVKGKKFRFGFKKHILTNDDGLILNVITSSANESDTKFLPLLIQDSNLAKNGIIFADRGYVSKSNEEAIENKGYISGIMHKASKGKPLSKELSDKNKYISQHRYVVERTFGSIKRWFGGGTARYVGLEKMQMQNILESIAYNLYRAKRLYEQQLPIYLK